MEKPSPDSSVVIRPMLDSEVEAVVEVHLRTFTGFFLSFSVVGFSRSSIGPSAALLRGSYWLQLAKRASKASLQA